MSKIIEYKSSSEFLDKLATFDVCENPYQSYAFYSVYLEFFGGGKYRFFDVYNDEEQLVGIVPLQCYKKLLGVELLRFVGYGQFNYEQFICKKENTEFVYKIFTNHIKTRKKPVVIDYFDINNTSPLFELLAKEKLKKTIVQLYGCPLVSFKDDNFDDFFKNAFKEAKKRTELKKFQKKLEGVGDLKICNIKDIDTYNLYKKHIPKTYRVFSERFADVYATSFFSSESMRAYYDKLILTLMEHEKGFISMMMLDDILIAFIFCLANHNTLIDWIPAFDPAFSKYNLGTVQYKMLFEGICADKSYEYFDFSKGSTVYKKKWSKDETYNYQFIINFSPKNVIASLMYVIYKTFFRLKTRMRNNGMNGKIKFLLGSLRNLGKKEQKKMMGVNIIEVDATSSNKTVSYSEVVHLPVGVRKEILDRIYSGWRLVELCIEKNVVTAKMSKI